MSAPAGALCALGSALTWALVGLVARAVAPYFNALVVNMLRSAFGGVLLALFVLTWGGLEALGSLGNVDAEAWVYLTLSVITGFALGDTMFFESSKRIGLAPAFTVSMIHPVLTSALAVWLFGERLTPFLAAGGVIALGGLILIVTDQAPGPPGATAGRSRGFGLALLAACCWAVGTLVMKPAVRDVDPVTIQAARLPMTALALWITPWARGAGRRLRANLRDVAPLLLALGGLTAVSAVLFVAGLKYAGVAITTILSSTSPLFALPIGLLAFREPVTWRAVVGAGLCIAGLAVLSA